MLETKCSGTSILWQILLMFANESRKPDVSRNHLMATACCGMGGMKGGETP